MNASTVSSLAIRAATLADAPAVQSLFAAHLAAIGLCPDPDLDADMHRYAACYVPPRGLLLLAEAEGAGVVGMAGLLDGEIRRVFVKESWRRQRVARRLVETLLNEGPLPAGRRFRAVIAPWNLPSRTLFLSLGFLPTGKAVTGSRQSCELYELDLSVALSRCPASPRAECMSC